MTTQTYEGQTKVTTRGVVVGKIRQLETALEMYEQDPFWDFHKKAGGVDFSGFSAEERDKLYKERMVPRYGETDVPVVMQIRRLISTYSSIRNRMDDVAQSTSRQVMDAARTLDAINAQLPEGQKLIGNESWSYSRCHVEDVLGREAADKFFNHSTWTNFRGLPDNDPLYQKLMQASKEMRFRGQRNKTSELYQLAQEIAERKMSEEKYTALSNEDHALWRDLASVMQAD
ncbi:MAG TPA: hypothetical protein VJH37_01800 [Candidatus Nanoarchaeia archaeon]|nr:hypothetical protein [Candidatus Nanoarchaeia archaeon]